MRDHLSSARYASFVWSLPDDRAGTRERAGLSLSDVAEIVGTSSGAVRRWEMGDQPDGRFIERYAAVLHACRAIVESRSVWARLGLERTA